MKIGDNVRFLNEVGGGKIAGFQGKGIVLVEDANGFQIPVASNEVVVVAEDNYDTPAAGDSKKSGSSVAGTDKHNVSSAVENSPVAHHYVPEERSGGDKLSVYIAFVPVDIKVLTSTLFETYIVNDSNYYIFYTYLCAERATWHLRSSGEIEPNTKLFIEEFGRDKLGEMERIAVQIVVYKRNKTFILKQPVSTQIRVDATKFYKLHTFRENDFFEQPALLHTIIENDTAPRALVINADELKKGMLSKAKADNTPRKAAQPPRRKNDDGSLVVDLHANELLDITAGMSSSDILNHQLDIFRKTMEQYKNKKGQRIVFIHGKGEGVLRHAVIHELSYRYKHCSYQDASFSEYGYGATQVTIK